MIILIYLTLILFSKRIISYFFLKHTVKSFLVLFKTNKEKVYVH
jgi:hypothetical protein